MTAFDRLEPVSDRYAAMPIGAAFTWSAVADAVPVGELYLVAFRSVRSPDTDEDRLSAYDDLAHAEATVAPGFVHYFKGPRASDGSCLSFCLWTSRADARAAAAMPAHREAVGLVREMYALYQLEFHRVTKRQPDGQLEFEPYDAAPSAPEPATRPVVVPFPA